MNYPLVSGPVLVNGAGATCLLPDRVVEVSCQGRALHALLKQCDGRTGHADIVAHLEQSWAANDLKAFMAALEQEGVLTDANTVFARLWEFVKLPRHLGGETSAPAIETLTRQAHDDISSERPGMTYHPVEQTPFKALLDQRASTRWFGRETVALSQIIGMLGAAYGVGPAGRRAVPSAGGLYPLQIHLLNLRDTGELSRGIYRTHFLHDGRVGLALTAPLVPEWTRAWLDPTLVREAHGVFVISGNMPRTATKYGNRAALLVPLEAGHAAQNILLAAVQANLGAVELGGFIENTLAPMLRLTPEITPLLTLAFGTQANAADRQLAEQAVSVELRWISEARTDYTLPLHVASARVAQAGEDSADWCWGRDTDAEMACTKASAEALERHACAHPAGLYFARHDELDHAIDPRTVLAYLPAQYARPDFPFSPFEPSGKYLWKDGLDYTSGRKVAMLADLVYWGHGAASGRERPYASTSTSGVAAYPSYQGALERAVLELIERDAFMRVWLSRGITPTVQPASLPGSVRERLQALAAIGVAVQVKDFSQGLAPVVCVFAQNPAWHFTRVAAACAYDPEEALHQALAEVETAVALFAPGKERRLIAPEDVATPRDHGDLYTQRRYFRRADFLTAEGSSVALRQVGAGMPRDWNALTALLAAQGKKILHFDLSFPGAALRQGREPLAIVRAIVPGLVPISFGWRTEPLATVRAELQAGMPPRARTGSSYFPHPFT